jgi:hypothetical protein
MERAPYLGFRWRVLPHIGMALHLSFRWGELGIRASDGEGSLSGLWMGSLSYLVFRCAVAPCLSFRWGGLSILALDGESSLSGLQITRRKTRINDFMNDYNLSRLGHLQSFNMSRLGHL